MNVEPRFRVEGKGRKSRVFLDCSECSEEIRELGKHETINVTRAYYCTNCDDGAIHINFPTSETDGET